MIRCSWSSREGSVRARLAAARTGPATAAFLRGVPGVAGSDPAGFAVRLTVRLAAGAPGGLVGGFLAMVSYSRYGGANARGADS
jgi:hypothetical protein